MRHLRRGHKNERGQILVLFELSMIVILGFAAMVIDLGVLRNNRQILVNTLDAAALAGGTLLPVEGLTEATAAKTLIDHNIAQNYPGLTDYDITYKCLIGADTTTGAPLIDRDWPGVCDPRHALGHNPVVGDFIGAGPTRISECDPSLGDKCNVVVITGSVTVKYALAPVVGINSGSTGTVVAAACKGPCGAASVVPVDLVVILDRTGSMAGSSGGLDKITSLQKAAKAILSVYNPAKQRVALALVGPSKVDAAGNPVTGSCDAGGSSSVYGTNDNSNWVPETTLAQSMGTTTLHGGATTLAGGATTLDGTTTLAANINKNATQLTVPAATGFPTSGSYYILVESEQMKVTAGAGTTTWTISRAQNGTTAVKHNSGVAISWIMATTDTKIVVDSSSGFPTTGTFYIEIDNEQMKVTAGAGTTTWTVARGQNGTVVATHNGGTAVQSVVGAADTKISVASASGFPTSGTFSVKIDTEQLLITGGAGTTTWTVTRGQDSTAPSAHGAGTAVQSTVGTADTRITVASASGFPTSGAFSVKIDNEWLLVTAGAGTTTWTVTRAQNGTSAAKHNDGAVVLTLTAKVASNAEFPSSGTFLISIDSEVMQVTAGAGSTTWTVTRGYNSSPIAGHASGASVNRTDVVVPGSSTVGMWVPVGLSGTDTMSPLPNPNGAAGTYSDGGVVQTTSTIVRSINCIEATSDATNLSTPILMAQWYLDHYGRKGVTQGIILETDGHPQNGFGHNNNSQAATNASWTCKAAVDAAAAAKADTTNSPDGIQIFTVGYGVDSSSKCPTTSTNWTDSNTSSSRYEDPAWSGVAATTLLRTMATDVNHYYENPPSSTLASVFTQAAIALSHSGSHLIQIYPNPIVTGVSGSTVSGQYFTGAYQVSFGGTAASISSVSDTSISVTPPHMASGTVVDVIVTTPAGSSYITSADKYTYP